MTYCKNYCEEKGISTSELNEAQRTLYYIAENMKMDKSISEEGYRNFQMAIQALEQEPSGDAVSREAVDDILCLYSDGNGMIDARGAVRMVRELPSVNPQPIGYWIVETGDRETGYGGCTMCSECSGEGNTEMDYCPNCGCRMVEPQERELMNT